MISAIVLMAVYSGMGSSLIDRKCCCGESDRVSATHSKKFGLDQSVSTSITVTSKSPISCPLKIFAETENHVMFTYEAVGEYWIEFVVQQHKTEGVVGRPFYPRKVRIKVKNAIAGAVKEGGLVPLSAEDKASPVLDHFKVRYDQEDEHSWPNTTLQNLVTGGTIPRLEYQRLDPDRKPSGSFVETLSVATIRGYPGNPDPPGSAIDS